MTVVLTGCDLTLDEVVRVARGGEPVDLAPQAVERMRESRVLVERVLERGDAVYGMTTGVGMRKKFRIGRERARHVQPDADPEPPDRAGTRRSRRRRPWRHAPTGELAREGTSRRAPGARSSGSSPH